MIVSILQQGLIGSLLLEQVAYIHARPSGYEDPSNNDYILEFQGSLDQDAGDDSSWCDEGTIRQCFCCRAKEAVLETT